MEAVDQERCRHHTRLITFKCPPPRMWPKKIIEVGEGIGIGNIGLIVCREHITGWCRVEAQGVSLSPIDSFVSVPLYCATMPGRVATLCEAMQARRGSCLTIPENARKNVGAITDECTELTA